MGPITFEDEAEESPPDAEAEKATREFLERLQTCRFDPDNLTTPRDPVATIRGRTAATRGNVTTLVGADKSGKSHLLGGLGRAITQKTRSLGFESEAGGKIVYLDFEQDREDFERLILKQFKDAENVEAYCLTGYEVGEAKAAVKALLDNSENLSAVFVDGFGDLCLDVNDAAEACALVSWLMKLASGHDVAIVGVLHLNPQADEKARGHLGSQLFRKSQTVLKVDAKEDERRIFTLRARKRPLPEREAVRIGWDEDAGCFAELEGTPGEAKAEERREELARLLEQVEAYTDAKGWRHADLWRAIADVEGVKERTAKARIAALCGANLLLHQSAKGTYTSNLEKANGATA